MPFLSNDHINSLDLRKQEEVFQINALLGENHRTKNGFFLPDADRYMGTYVLGVQGQGKSTLLEQLISHDMTYGSSIIVIDPHGDLIDRCVSFLPISRIAKTTVLDMEDENFPFGINIFTGVNPAGSIALAQAVDRMMHVFEVLWPEVMSQQYLPLYVRAATMALLATPGSTLLDMQRFLQNAKVRHAMLKNVTDPTVLEFMEAYDDLAEADRDRRTQALVNRLTALFMGRSLVRNIVGQRENTIDFRKAIENKEIILIRLPLKKIPHDARLIGTLLVAQIHAAVFSFADMPKNKRPGVSIYVDEFQHFATPDFSELFTEGRKFGCRVTLAHQHREQLPDYLKSSTMTAYTKICFRTTPSDAREMAHLFHTNYAEVRQEDIEKKVSRYLLDDPSENYEVRQFTDKYLRPLQAMRREGKEGKVEITNPGLDILRMFAKAQPNPWVYDPTTYIDALLHDVMETKRATLPIAPEIAFGFSNCGWGFYRKLMNLSQKDRQWLLSSDVGFPDKLTEYTPYGVLRWVRPPENVTEQMYHFVFFLRKTMEYLAQNPVGKETSQTSSDIAQMLTHLPRGMVFVSSGQDVGEVNTPKPQKGIGVREGGAVRELMKDLQEQTRQRYARPRSEVEARPAASAAKDIDVPSKPKPTEWEELE
ncbi:MAG TPA: hypothetical protein VFV38_31410 [Ktedonobacteraceae bacterium]|nr:hypothetical protein [Ktedonobacteraceae bacterium]